MSLTVSSAGNNYYLSLCKPEGALCILDVPLEGTLFWCENYTTRPDIRLCEQSFDLLNYLDLLWDESENVNSFG